MIPGSFHFLTAGWIGSGWSQFESWSAIVNRSDESLTLEISTSFSVHGGNLYRTHLYDSTFSCNRPRSIYQHSNKAPRLSGQNFLSFFCVSIPKRDLNTKKTSPNLEVCPESLGAMLEY